MATIIYSDSTRRFLQELDKQCRLTHHTNDRHLRTPKQLKGVRRLYENDTSKFEPIHENRDHLIKTLMPMVVKIAKGIAAKYGSRIEYDDCVSSGLQGAIIATDKYIEKSSIEPQPAKLSTYAHSYIVKYINEYCASVNTILSHGTTKWVEASADYVMSGNQTYQEDGKAVEFFDIANDKNLTSVQKDVLSDDETVDAMSKKLFSMISPLDKEILFMSFGIGSVSNEQLAVKDIAIKLDITMHYVTESIEKSVSSLRALADAEASPIRSMVKTLLSSDMSASKHWQRRSTF